MHPYATNYTKYCKDNLDYIFYNPKAMIVIKLLDLPSRELLNDEGDMPSKSFPSDHMRIMT